MVQKVAHAAVNLFQSQRGYWIAKYRSVNESRVLCRRKAPRYLRFQQRLGRSNRLSDGNSISNLQQSGKEDGQVWKEDCQQENVSRPTITAIYTLFTQSDEDGGGIKRDSKYTQYDFKQKEREIDRDCAECFTVIVEKHWTVIVNSRINSRYCQVDDHKWRVIFHI